MAASDLRTLLLGVLLAAATCALMLGATLLAPRRARPAWSGALAVSVAYAAGHIAVAGWPGFVPLRAFDWLAHIAIAAGVLSAAAAAWPRALTALGVLWGVLIVASLRAAVYPLLVNAGWWGGAALWLAILAAGLAVFTVGVRAGTDRTPGALCPAIAGIGAAVALALGGSVRLGVHAGILGAALSPIAVLAMALPRPRIARAGAGPAMLILGLLLIHGAIYDLPAVSILMLAASAASGLAVRISAGRGFRPWVATLTCVMLAAGLAAAAAALAHDPSPY